MRRVYISERDQYLVLLGLFFAFLFQVFYDLIHETINYYNLSGDWFWIQIIIASVIIVILVFLIGNLRKENKEES